MCSGTVRNMGVWYGVIGRWCKDHGFDCTVAVRFNHIVLIGEGRSQKRGKRETERDSSRGRYCQGGCGYLF